MGADRAELTREKSEDRHQDNSLVDDVVEVDKENLHEFSKHRSKDRKKSRREEKDSRNREKDRLKAGDDSKDREAKDSTSERVSSREKRKDDKHRDKEHERDRDRRDRGNGSEHDREGGLHKDIERGLDKERGKEKHRDREKDREDEKARDRHWAKDREKDKEKSRGREKEREYARDDKEKGKGKGRDRDSEVDRGAAKPSNRNIREDGNDRSKDNSLAEASSSEEEDGMIIEPKVVADATSERPNQSTTELEERISRMREERTKNKSEGACEILSWVSKSRVIEEKLKAEKAKALQRSKIFEEQDHVDEEDSDDEATNSHIADGLGGVKVLHGLDKVIEGGSVVLTLKDQSILANGDVNEDVDMLENVEIGEQKRRDNAYKAAKKKTGVYDDKFNDEPGSERKMLPQYDEVVDEGVSLDAIGRFTGEAEKKLEELRNRLKGSSVSSSIEDLTTSAKIASDYYTQEEMAKFKKPKKKKSLRKKDKLDLDALEAEAISSGLGASDLGSRNDAKTRAAKEEQERSESERRNSAYQAAFVKADEASRALRITQTPVQDEEADTPLFADDAEDLQKSLERSRKLALKKQNEVAASGVEAIARLASKTTRHLDDSLDAKQSLESQVVVTEMEEFVQGLQLDEEADKLRTEDVFMEEDELPETLKEEIVVDVDGPKDSNDPEKGKEDASNEDVVRDDIIHEVPVGKGIAGALRLLKDRGDLKETVEWGGRNMDKKKSKLVGIYDEQAQKEIRIERTDEYGRILTPKEAFRQLSHKFHGKGPGKMKQEKRLRQWEDEMKLKKMKNADTPSQSVERMREALAQAKTPHIVLSGNVKTGQNGDPTGGFSTVGKDFPGGLTPMLGDKKVEHFLGIKRKAGPAAESGIPKKPKT